MAKPTSASSRQELPAKKKRTSTTMGADANNTPLTRPTKLQLTVRIDTQVLRWLKKGGAGYQTRMNQLLTDAMMSNLGKSSKRSKAKNHRKAS